jgi:hypothetical protein
MGIAARGSSLGTTLRDHVNVDGDIGRNQETVRAYGREGEPCYECGGAMRRIKIGGRSSVFCPKCQPAPRGASKRAGAPKKRAKPRLHARAAVCRSDRAWAELKLAATLTDSGGRDVR